MRIEVDLPKVAGPGQVTPLLLTPSIGGELRHFIWLEARERIDNRRGQAANRYFRVIALGITDV